MTRISTAGMGVLALALCGAIALELINGADRPAGLVPDHAAVAGPATTTLSPTSAPDINRRLSQILARPLFSPERRPSSNARGVAGLSRLTGIVVSGSRRIAIFDGAGGLPVIAEEGSHINSFAVTSISETGVTVAGPDGTMVMAPVFAPAQASRPLKPVVSASPAAQAPQKR